MEAFYYLQQLELWLLVFPLLSKLHFLDKIDRFLRSYQLAFSSVPEFKIFSSFGFRVENFSRQGNLKNSGI